MISKYKLALRRARNRNRRNKLVAVWSGANQIIDSNTTMPSYLQGYRWVRKPIPDDGTGFSWYEERIESAPLKIDLDGRPIEDNTQIFLNPTLLTKEERDNMFKVHDNVTY